MTGTRQDVDARVHTERTRLISVLDGLDEAQWAGPSLCGFNVPGSPVEAPLSHLVIHARDVYRPLGVPSPTDPDNARIALEQVTGPRGRRALPPGLLDGLAFSATDTDWRHGEGAEVSGPATALLTTLFGRSAALPDLAGAGVTDLRARLRPA